MNTINIIENRKQLRYVTIYNKLFEQINNGIFSIDSRLPSEPELAKELGVSRTTLRQALALLQDDGLIKNIRGKGNFIISQATPISDGLEKTGHLVYKCLNSKIDDVEMDFHLEPPSEYFAKILGKKPVATVSIDRWYKSNGNVVAYTFTVVPIETISTFNLDLNNNHEILRFIQDEIYSECINTNVEIKFSCAATFATKKYSIPSEKKFYLLEESIFKNQDFPLAVNKHYLPLSDTSLKIYSSKKSN